MGDQAAGSPLEVEVDDEYAYPHRVYVWVVPMLPLVWGCIACVIWTGYYYLLRKGQAKTYADAQQGGETRDAPEGDDGEGKAKCAPRGEGERGIRGVHLSPPGPFLRNSIPWV